MYLFCTILLVRKFSDVFPGLHCCLTAQNPEGRPHAFAYVMDVNTTEKSGSSVAGAEAAAEAAVRACVCCAAVFSISLDYTTPYDVADMLKPRSGALICTTCAASPAAAGAKHPAVAKRSTKGSDNDGQNFVVCSKCTRLTHDALLEAKKCGGGAFGISRTLHLKDMIAFHLFLQRIDASIARAFLVFPAQVGFNTTIYQGTAATVHYVEALSIVNRARHSAMVGVKPSTSTPAAIIYTAFHTFFVTHKCLSIAIASRASVDSLLAAAKAAKTASKAASALPPTAPISLLERKRKRDESNYTCRGLDMEIRVAEAHRLNMTLAIEQIRAVIKARV